MVEWRVQEWSREIDLEEIAHAYNTSFPQRPVCFFREILDRLERNTSRLYLLVVNRKIVGAVLGFKVYGYEGNDVWAPSYLYVEDGYRKYSISFIQKAYKKMSTRILITSPNALVKDLMSKLKYRSISQGSAAIPVCFAPLRWRRRLKHLPSENRDFLAFRERADVRWYETEDGPIAVKRTRRRGITVFIIVYSNYSKLYKHLYSLLCSLFLQAPHGILIVVDRNALPKIYHRKIDKFHLMANFEVPNKSISVLGSEITELL